MGIGPMGMPCWFIIGIRPIMPPCCLIAAICWQQGHMFDACGWTGAVWVAGGCVGVPCCTCEKAGPARVNSPTIADAMAILFMAGLLFPKGIP